MSNLLILQGKFIAKINQSPIFEFATFNTISGLLKKIL